MNCHKEHWGLEFSPEIIRECRERNGLLSLELELSRACNLRCVYCYASSGTPLAGEMTKDEIFSIIDQAADLGARKIIVLGGGEPMLYPHIFPVMDHILAKGLEVDLFTNGTLLDAQKAEALYERNVSISIKMNSRKPEVQDYLAGKPGTHAAIEKGLAALMAAGYPDENHTLGVETIVCQQNYDELPDLWRWARQNGIIPYIEIMTAQGRATKNGSLEVDQAAIRTLFEKLAYIDNHEFECKWTPMPPLAASHCARHEYSCTVTSLGEVHPCPGVNISTGTIREQSLAKIIQTSHVISDLRNIRNNIKGNCSKCSHKQLCYGCRGHAYQVTGDYLAADPICWLHE
ncbi:MAG: radical SAM protein [Desulfobulbaceae bacterium]|nr:radical SAM protein [Desulfobulbaceae bacterium]